MEKHLMATAEAEGAALVSQEVAALQQANGQMAAMIGQLAEMVIILEGRTQAMEVLMQQRATITSGQAKQITVAVRNRAMRICEKNGLPYEATGGSFRNAIWRDFKTEYAVHSHYDLPAMYLDNALAFIEGWTSFTLICKARERVPR